MVYLLIFAFKFFAAQPSMDSAILSETVANTMDDPHGCGKFPEAYGTRRDVGVEPTGKYSRRVSERIAESINRSPT